ncbi:DCC1-like thiol-disulfide oxidoreductase family protein [Myxococcota bacterium]
MSDQNGYHIELFYDGACPLCSREVKAIRRLDRKGRIQFTDIADSGCSRYRLLPSEQSDSSPGDPSQAWIRLGVAG